MKLLLRLRMIVVERMNVAIVQRETVRERQDKKPMTWSQFIDTPREETGLWYIYTGLS